LAEARIVSLHCGHGLVGGPGGSGLMAIFVIM
jgi:hypothetical protein